MIIPNTLGKNEAIWDGLESVWMQKMEIIRGIMDINQVQEMSMEDIMHLEG